LLAIAVAGDSKRREFWFTNESKSLFIYRNFLLIFFPGLISVGGLTPLSSIISIPPWIITTFVISLIFIIFHRKIKNKKETRELEKRNSVILNPLEIGLCGIILSILAFIAAWVNSEKIYAIYEASFCVILLFSVISGTFFTIQLICFDEAEKVRKEDETKKERSDQPNLVEQINIVDGKFKSGLYVLLGLILAVLGFIAGKLSRWK